MPPPRITHRLKRRNNRIILFVPPGEQNVDRSRPSRTFVDTIMDLRLKFALSTNGRFVVDVFCLRCVLLVAQWELPGSLVVRISGLKNFDLWPTVVCGCTLLFDWLGVALKGNFPLGTFCCGGWTMYATYCCFPLDNGFKFHVAWFWEGLWRQINETN